METYLIGIDTSKHFFQVSGVTRGGEKVFEKKVQRRDIAAFVRSQPSCHIAMEVGSGSHYWGRLFETYGHCIRLIPAAFVKPYVKSHKNDRVDAEAIAEAALRPSMRFVAVKRVEQQDLQNIHRLRERLVASRTAAVNQLRGFLGEYGVVLPQGLTKFRRLLSEALAKIEPELSALAVGAFHALQQEIADLDKRVAERDKQIEQICKAHPICKQALPWNRVARGRRYHFVTSGASVQPTGPYSAVPLFPTGATPYQESRLNA